MDSPENMYILRRIQKIHCGPRHTPNPSTLRTFFLQKNTNKKLLTFSEKFYEHFKIILQHLLKLYRRHYPLKKLPDFNLQDVENFISWKKCYFYDFSEILEFNLPFNRQVLTKCCLKYFRSIRNLLLMFFIFWIMVVSPKLKKIFDGTYPLPKKKGLFWWGGVYRLKVEGF